MNYLETKIDRFISSIIESATNESRTILSQVEKEHDEFISARENEFLTEAYKNIKDEVQKIKADCGRELSKKMLDCKRELYKRRHEIEGEILDRLRARVLDYTKTAGYKGDLLDMARRAAERLPSSSPCDIYLREADMAFAADVKQCFPGDARIISGTIELGGLVVVAETARIRIDNTYDIIFAEIGARFAEMFQNAIGSAE